MVGGFSAAISFIPTRWLHSGDRLKIMNNTPENESIDRYRNLVTIYWKLDKIS